MNQRPFVFSVDSTADFPAEFAKEAKIAVHPLHYLLGGKEYGIEIGEPGIEEFYGRIRKGEMPTTNATSLDYDIQLMKEQVQAGFDIIHLSFSSAMSTSYSNAVLAAKQVQEEFPQARIEVIDTLSAIGGISLMVEEAMKLQEQGQSFDEVVSWIRETAPHMLVHFTVPDLMHLMRGGRIGRGTAIMATALRIQPVLHIDDTGHLVNLYKVRGRQKAIEALAREVKTLSDAGNAPERIAISHGDCEEDAKLLASLIQEQTGISHCSIRFMSPTLGSHAGPGVLALAYKAPQR